MVNDIGILYKSQGKLTEAEQTYERALCGYERAFCEENTTTYIPSLNTKWVLGALYES